MLIAPRILRWWHRRPGATHWAVVVGIALLAALFVGTARSSAESAIAAWGEPAYVLQARRLLASGELPSTTDVELVPVPEHLIPEQVLTTLEQLRPLGRAVPRGSILTAGDLSELTAVPLGRVGIGISVNNAAPTVGSGTQVELLLFSAVDPYEPISTEPVRRVLGVVLSTDEKDWLVGVSPLDAEAVARTTIDGVIVPLLRASVA